MKKTISLLLACLLAAGCVGCGKAPASSASTNSLPGSGPDSAPPPVQADTSSPLRLASPQTSHGLFARNFVESHSVFTHIDFDTQEEQLLCTTPGCTHAQGQCTACLPEHFWCSGVAALDDDTLLYAARTLDRTDGGVFLIHRDGRPVDTLARSTKGVNLGAPIALDDQYVYLPCEFGDPQSESVQQTICRVPLSGGKIEPLFDQPSSYSWLGAEGRELILQLDQEDSQQVVVRKNIDTGETQEIARWQWQENSPSHMALLSGQRLYRFSASLQQPILWQDLDGGSGELAVNWPPEYLQGSSHATLELATDQDLIVLLDQQDSLHRFRVSLADGQVTEIPLSYVNQKQPIRIISTSSDCLLAEYLYEEVSEEVLGEEGIPQEAHHSKVQMGILSMEDFLAGNANYQPIQPLF